MSYTLNKFLGAAALLSTALLITLHANAAAPSTFGMVIGQGLLCMDQLDSGYYYNYLFKAFGKPYKHEGGAHWFKTPGSLWGSPVSEVLVSDGDTKTRFIAAVVDQAPDLLATAIFDAVQITFNATSLNPKPIRMSQTGSTIIYFQKKSKIFCAKSKVLMPD